MALRWSEKDAAASVSDTDEGLIRRGNANFRFSFTVLRTWLATLFAPLSHVSDTSNPHSVTAAQTGADPAGTATSAVAAHDASGAAHGGVEAAFAAHDGAGGAVHAEVVASGAAGFMSGADKTKLDALDPAQTGTLREVRDEGLQVSDGDKILDFVGAGVTATAAGGTTTVTIPGGGGSVNNPPSVKGDLWTFHTGDTQRLPVSGTDGRILVEASAQTPGIAWADPNFPQLVVGQTAGTLVAFKDAQGEQQGTSIAATDVARLSVANTFNETQTIENAAIMGLDLDNRTGNAGTYAEINLLGNFGANTGNWQVANTNGSFSIRSRNDDKGTPKDDGLVIVDSGGAYLFGASGGAQGIDTFNASALYENAVRVTYQPDKTESGATVQLALDGSQRVVISGAGAVTIEPPASGTGSLEVILETDRTITLGTSNGGWTTRGTAPSGSNVGLSCYVTVTANLNIWSYGA